MALSQPSSVTGKLVCYGIDAVLDIFWAGLPVMALLSPSAFAGKPAYYGVATMRHF